MKKIQRLQRFLASAMFCLALPPEGAVTVSWQPNSDADLKGYKVYVRADKDNYSAGVDVGNNTQFQYAQLEPDTRYYFVVTAYDSSGNESGFSQEVSAILNSAQQPEEDEEVFNFPNPFVAGKETTRIRFFLHEPATVTIRIYDVNNEKVRELVTDAPMAVGEHTEIEWDGRNDHGELVAQGVYYCQVRTNTAIRIHKIAVLREVAQQ